MDYEDPEKEFKKQRRAARFQHGHPKKLRPEPLVLPIHAPDPPGADTPDWRELKILGTCQDVTKRYLRLTCAPDPSTVRPVAVGLGGAWGSRGGLEGVLGVPRGAGGSPGGSTSQWGWGGSWGFHMGLRVEKKWRTVTAAQVGYWACCGAGLAIGLGCGPAMGLGLLWGCRGAALAMGLPHTGAAEVAVGGEGALEGAPGLRLRLRAAQVHPAGPDGACGAEPGGIWGCSGAVWGRTP